MVPNEGPPPEKFWKSPPMFAASFSTSGFENRSLFRNKTNNLRKMAAFEKSVRFPGDEVIAS